MSAKSRLKRLENRAFSGDFADVLSWIRAGRFYDELTGQERARYCLYRYGPGHEEPPEEYLARVMGEPFDSHFRLEYKPKPPTLTEIRERAEWVQEYMEEHSREYNSPENQEKRRCEYEELQEIGRKRREAFYAGKPMSDYPLPWE